MTFVGKWEQTDISNADKLAEIMGVPADKRAEAIEKMKVMTIEIKKDGDHFHLTAHTPVGAREVKVAKGEDDDYITTTGKVLRTHANEVTDTIIRQDLRNPDNNEKIGELENTIEGDKMYSAIKLKGVESVRTYKRV